ncbi:MAG: right-handed parallel beta-helix repeat-containing protein, partial [Victivallaceae bacterium]
MFSIAIASAADISVTAFGITGSGDESTKLQTAFNAIATTGDTLTIPSGMTITVTKNLFLHGSCSIRGLGANNSSTIQCDADLDNSLPSGRQYWISVGISNHRSYGGTQHTFHGSIKDLTIKATSNAKFCRAIFIFNTDSTTIDNVKFDFTSGVSTPPGDSYLFGATESGNNANWEPSGAISMSNVTIKNSAMNTNHSYLDSEGFGLANVNTVLIDNNVINNVGDDPIACHNATNVTITNNTCYSIDGRILVTNCKNVT